VADPCNGAGAGAGGCTSPGGATFGGAGKRTGAGADRAGVGKHTSKILAPMRCKLKRANSTFTRRDWLSVSKATASPS
jgi:hypothetical protein